jgi:hypothetical protein
MPFDKTPDGEGEPIDEGGPEWESVEQERGLLEGPGVVLRGEAEGC